MEIEIKQKVLQGRIGNEQSGILQKMSLKQNIIFMRTLLEKLKLLRDNRTLFDENNKHSSLTSSIIKSLVSGLNISSPTADDFYKINDFIETAEEFLKAIESEGFRKLPDSLLEELAELECLLGMLKKIEEENSGIFVKRDGDNNNRKEIEPSIQWILRKMLNALGLGGFDITSIPKNFAENMDKNIEKFILMVKKHVSLMRSQLSKE